ncbi:MAG: cytochrome ubiquinol oxidase subunit I [Acidocella sp. 20-57-95]|nr:MAG: cytochrome ubiquinol oxidase subunit I [Acidocella sp. 20-57-95]
MSFLPFFASPTAIEMARAQFGFVIAFHIIFPAFSIGLASFLAVLEGAWLWTKQPVYLDAFKYWLKIFAMIFAIGVVSGLVMAYEIGANWGGYADKVGPVLGPLLAYETLTAFFLEAGFLGIMLFGLDRVGPKLHFAATCLVSIGTLISATWILSANSWMQTPAGTVMGANGQIVPVDWLAIIFSPSAPYRWVHMILASYLATAFMVGGVGAYHLLRDRKNQISRLFFSMALWMAAIVTPLQILAGDTQGQNTLAYQPAKIAGMEGDFTTGVQALHLFGIPDVAQGKLLYDVAIPHLGSFILTHDWNGVVKGLDAWPKDQWPVVSVEFFTFRIMVALGFAMFGLGLLSLWLRYKRRLYDTKWFHYLTMLMAPSGFIAIVMGWTTTETGRQPWTVYGLVTTAQSASPISLPVVMTSFAVIIVIYALVFGSGILYVLKMMAKLPEPGESMPDDAPLRSHGLVGQVALGDKAGPVAAE